MDFASPATLHVVACGKRELVEYVGMKKVKNTVQFVK